MPASRPLHTLYVELLIGILQWLVLRVCSALRLLIFYLLTADFTGRVNVKLSF